MVIFHEKGSFLVKVDLSKRLKYGEIFDYLKVNTEFI